MDPAKDHEPREGTAGAAPERRRSRRYPCQRLVVVRLPDAYGVWRWYWVTDVSAGGVAVSFLVDPESGTTLETTLLDVDAALSFAVSIRLAWHHASERSRSGYAILRADPGLAKWCESFARENRRRGRGEAASLPCDRDVAEGGWE